MFEEINGQIRKIKDVVKYVLKKKKMLSDNYCVYEDIIYDVNKDIAIIQLWHKDDNILLLRASLNNLIQCYIEDYESKPNDYIVDINKNIVHFIWNK